MTVGAVGVVGLVLVDVLDRLAVAPPAMLVIEAVGTASFVAALIAAVWRWRSSPGRGRAIDCGRGEPGLGPRGFAPVLWTAVILLASGLWLLGAPSATWTVVIVALLAPAIAAARALVGHVFDRANAEARTDSAAGDETGARAMASGATTPADSPEPAEEAKPDEEPERGRYDTSRPIVDRLARFVLVIAAVLGLGLAWGVDVWSLSTASTLAGRAFGVAVDITFAALIADLVWVWAKSAIDHRMADYEAPQPGVAPGPEARMATLLPLLRKILLVTLLAMVALIALSSLGINVGPLLAGAGVVGIAIGFGAQALVQDIVSGIFFLIDDAFRVGEYIETGALRGTVESISIRSLRLRHHRGAVHTVPFGQLASLTNYSRDWVMMKLEFRVPFDVDLKLIKKIVKDIGKELQENPEYGHHILAPLKSQGVRRMEEFNMVVGVKFMTRPGEQWSVRRDAYQRIRDAFDAHGITFARRDVKVEVVTDRPLTEEVKNAVLGAAQDAVEQQAAPGAPVPTAGG